MGILPSHAPTVAQLRSGVVEIHNGEDKESYFVSSGFAFVHKDRTDLCAVEAVKVCSAHLGLCLVQLVGFDNSSMCTFY